MEKKVSRRKRQYIDHSIQRGFLIALIGLEVVLVSASLYLLYLQLSQVINENMYRIHHVDDRNIFSLLLTEGFYLLVGVVVINALALLVANNVWTTYLNRILQSFTTLLNQIKSLDFRDENETADCPHETIKLTQQWKAFERKRCQSLRAEIQRLETVNKPLTTETRQELKTHMAKLRALLP